MKTLNFRSCLKKQMKDFVNLRRLAGTDYQSQAKLLEYFDNFLLREGFQSLHLTREIVQYYFSDNSHLHPRTLNNHFSVIRQFCDYLYQFDPLCYIPKPMKPVKSTASRIPYIYTKRQIRDLLAAATKLSPKDSLRPHTYYTLFGLLYTTGLRIGETLALNIDDFYQDSKLLRINEGKFHKARWVSLASSTHMMLKKYIDKRQRISLKTIDSALFISLNFTRLHYSTARDTLRTLLKQCGIHTNKESGPRLHDFRHTFAVHRMLGWYQNGQDINSLLPALATYMGHVRISSTQIYLQATAELLEQGNRRFLAYFRENIKNKGGFYE
jgi:site-specific recombinase XerD